MRDGKYGAPPRRTPTFPDHCRSGLPLNARIPICPEPPVPQRSFCAAHQAQLDSVKVGQKFVSALPDAPDVTVSTIPGHEVKVKPVRAPRVDRRELADRLVALVAAADAPRKAEELAADLGASVDQTRKSAAGAVRDGRLIVIRELGYAPANYDPLTPVRADVLTFLADHPESNQRVIMTALPHRDHTVKRAIQALAQAGEVVGTPTGYQLPEQLSDAA